MDKPLIQNKDEFYIDSFGQPEDGQRVYFERDILSAKRLLKQKLCYKNDFLNVVCKPGYQCKRCEIIDACFQIDDDKEKGVR